MRGYLNARRCACLFPVALLGAALATSCSDEPTGVETTNVTTRAALTALAPSQINITSGNNQTNVISTALPQQLVVRVVDANGVGVANTLVSWRVTLGGGTGSGLTERTDVNGYARAAWTLGATLGKQTVRAATPTNLAMVFSATGMKSGAVVLVKAAGDAQSGVVGATLKDSLKVLV